MLRTRGIKAVILQRADEIGHRRKLVAPEAGHRPSTRSSTKGRNVVERSFNDHKQCRGIAIRYDKLATVYRGAVVRCAITIRLTHLADGP